MKIEDFRLMIGDGISEEWNVGMLECWNVGILEIWGMKAEILIINQQSRMDKESAVQMILKQLNNDCN